MKIFITFSINSLILPWSGHSVPIKGRIIACHGTPFGPPPFGYTLKLTNKKGPIRIWVNFFFTHQLGKVFIFYSSGG